MPGSCCRSPPRSWRRCRPRPPDRMPPTAPLLEDPVDLAEAIDLRSPRTASRGARRCGEPSIHDSHHGAGSPRREGGDGKDDVAVLTTPEERFADLVHRQHTPLHPPRVHAVRRPRPGRGRGGRGLRARVAAVPPRRRRRPGGLRPPRGREPDPRWLPAPPPRTPRGGTSVVDWREGVRPESSVDDRALFGPALLLLPLEQRAVVVLRFLEDLSEEATAATLGVKLGTVKSRCPRPRAAAAAARPGRPAWMTSRVASGTCSREPRRLRGPTRPCRRRHPAPDAPPGVAAPRRSRRRGDRDRRRRARGPVRARGVLATASDTHEAGVTWSTRHERHVVDRAPAHVRAGTDRWARPRRRPDPGCSPTRPRSAGSRAPPRLRGRRGPVRRGPGPRRSHRRRRARRARPGRPVRRARRPTVRAVDGRTGDPDGGLDLGEYGRKRRERVATQAGTSWTATPRSRASSAPTPSWSGRGRLHRTDGHGRAYEWTPTDAGTFDVVLEGPSGECRKPVTVTAADPAGTGGPTGDPAPTTATGASVLSGSLVDRGPGARVGPHQLARLRPATDRGRRRSGSPPMVDGAAGPRGHGAGEYRAPRWPTPTRIVTSSGVGIDDAVLILFALVAESVGWATTALLDQDIDRANQVIADDQEVDERCERADRVGQGAAVGDESEPRRARVPGRRAPGHPRARAERRPRRAHRAAHRSATSAA